MSHGGFLGGVANSISDIGSFANPANWSIGGNSISNTSIGGTDIGQYLNPMSAGSKNAGETGATLVADYYTGGLASLANGWQSKGSQQQLGSTVGQVAQIGAGGAGAYNGDTVFQQSGPSWNTSGTGTMTTDQMGSAGSGYGSGGYSNAPASGGPMSSTGTGDMQALGETGAGNGWTMGDTSAGASLAGDMSAGGGGAAPTFMQQLGQGLQIGGGLFGMYAGAQNMVDARRQRQAQQALQAQQAGYQQQLQALAANPGSITNLPGYQAGLTAVERQMNAQGFQGSGNMMAELANYGQNAYNNQFSQLSNLAGLNFNPASLTQGQYNFSGMGGSQMAKSFQQLGATAQSAGF